MTDDLETLGTDVAAFIDGDRGDFDDLALRVHCFQRANCEPYRRYCETFPEPTCWKDIPALPLGAFRSASIRSFPEEWVVGEFRTSGTTGEGFGRHLFASTDLYQRAALAGWREAGLSRRGVVALMPHPGDAPHSSLSTMAGWLTDQFYPSDWANLAAHLMQATAPVTIFGTALAFLNWFEGMGDSALRLPAESVAVETGGYKGSGRDVSKSALHAMFRQHLGLGSGQIVNEYGMTEMSSQFYARGLGTPHRGGRWVRAIVINPETAREADDGETGVLKIFDLANVGSCAALLTRDLAIRQGEDFELLGRDPSALPRGCSRAADEALAR